MRWLKNTVQLAAAFVFAALCILPENGVNVPVIRACPLVQNQLYAEKDAYIFCCRQTERMRPGKRDRSARFACIIKRKTARRLCRSGNT